VKAEKQNLTLQKWITFVSVLLLIIKSIAYYLTNSVAILTDALESIVNVTAGFIGLYSLYVAAKPRDFDHPYGHGKAEFLSAAIEGTMITMAGLFIIYKAIKSFIEPVSLQKLDYGIYLVAATALVNFVMGTLSVAKGQRNNSIALIASGRHLQTDSYSTLGIIAGLILLYFTGLKWIDPVVAIVFGVIIIYTGYKILRPSIAGIMDEVDKKLLERLLVLLNNNRRDNWVDLHNLRVIKYGSVLHLDCHLTVPWYLNVVEAHTEVDALSQLVRKEFGESVELFVHTDPCLDFSCPICGKDCMHRKHNFEKKEDWTLENVLKDQKHQIQKSSEG